MTDNRFKDTISSMDSKRKTPQRRGIVEDFLPYRDEGFPKDSLTRNLAKFGPLISLGLFLLFAYIFQAEMRWIFCSAAFIFGGGVFIKPFIAGEFLKERGRDPSAMIAWTSLKSIAIVLLLGLVILHLEKPETPRWKSEVAVAQNNWHAAHPEKPFPKEEYFGFIMGETTFDQAIHVLNNAGASFDIKYVKGTDIRRIKTNSYGADFSIPIKALVLDFDDEGKVYSVHAWLSTDKCTYELAKERVINVSKAFKYKYDKENSGNVDFDPGKYQKYYTPGGVLVYFYPHPKDIPAWGRIEYTNLCKQEAVEKLREEARKRQAQLNASEIFDGRT